MNLFDRYYKRYDEWYNRNRFAYLSEVEAIKKALPKKGKGLEIGVGTGRFASVLGIEFGIDPSRKAIEFAKQRGVNTRFGYGENLPFKNGFFDYVAIIITICFVKDPLKVLKEAKRVLKKYGKLIIGIIDKNSFLGKYYMNKKSVFYKEANFFSINDITNLLETTGFRNFSYYQTIFHLPERVTSIEKPQKGFGKGGFVVISSKKLL